MQKFKAFNGNFITRRFHATPNGRGFRYHFDVGRERFNHNIAIVFDCFECFGDGFPIDVIVPGRAAVTAAGVKVSEQFAGFANGGCLVFLLDVHVERIEMDL